MHPGVPPNLTGDAFAAYAVDPNYPIDHLGELLGILLMTAAILALAWRLRRGKSGVWVVLGGAAMVISATVNAVLMAVDGVALGILVKQWVATGADQQELLYQTAYAVRQIEGGLISIQWFMFGIAAVLFAAAFFAGAESPVRFNWFSGMGWLSILASVGALSFGIVHAQTGFSDLSNAFEVGLFPGVLWIIAVGVFLYRNPVHTETTT